MTFSQKKCFLEKIFVEKDDWPFLNRNPELQRKGKCVVLKDTFVSAGELWDADLYSNEIQKPVETEK